LNPVHFIFSLLGKSALIERFCDGSFSHEIEIEEKDEETLAREEKLRKATLKAAEEAEQMLGSYCNTKEEREAEAQWRAESGVREEDDEPHVRLLVLGSSRVLCCIKRRLSLSNHAPDFGYLRCA
jgi:hypothetical protein